MNLFEVLKSAIKPFLDGEKPPLHVGEVMNLWFYLCATEQTMKGEQVAYNTVQNEELKKHIQDLQKIHEDIRKDITEFFQNEGVPLPRTTSVKNPGNFGNIPDDAKLSDEESALLLSENVVLGINTAARGLTESVRQDVGAMFARYFMMKSTFSITYKDFLQRQKWLLVPPAYKSELVTSS